MGVSGTRWWNAIERWSPVAFGVGGLGLLGTTVVGSLDVAGIAPATPRLGMGPLLVGLWFVFVGLLGVYPRLESDSPRLAIGGAVTSGIALVIWTGTLLSAVAVDLTTGRTIADPGSWGPPLLAAAFVLALVSFLVYGIACTRSARHPRALGLLLLVPVVAFLGQAILLVSKIATGEVIAVLQLGFGGVIALALGALGYLLWKDGATATGVDAPSEPVGKA